MPTRSEIEAEAMKLSPRERADLADKLWMSVHSQEEVDLAWEVEIARRLEELDAGRTQGIPAEQVMAEIRALIEGYELKTTLPKS
jgi:putative addiction module component (TIGR02574 family)